MLATAVVAVLAVVAALVTVLTDSNQCDNIAGTCIRGRQKAAIAGFQLASMATAVWALWMVVRAWRGRLSALGIAGLVVVAVFAAWLLAVRPVEKLNNSREGWLHFSAQPR